MSKIKIMASVAQFNNERGQDTLNPLITVIDQSLSKRILAEQYISELYIVFLKDTKCVEITYGRNKYDYQDETLIFIAPGQLLGLVHGSETIQPQGWAMAFHPDFIGGTSLGRKIHEYGFFSYDSTEALHVSKRERAMVIECFNKIIYELETPIDKHSRNLIINNIELFLNYCTRFYDRQFITRAYVNKDVFVRFETLLHEYFSSDKPQLIGLPSVAYCADMLHFSPNYFGDLVKKETGRSAQEYIHHKIMDLAKEKIHEHNKPISEIAYELGFKNPPHFTRLFKQLVGHSPSNYRQLYFIPN
jgi:AraC family transcriptional activator of pobA